MPSFSAAAERFIAPWPESKDSVSSDWSALPSVRPDDVVVQTWNPLLLASLESIAKHASLFCMEYRCITKWSQVDVDEEACVAYARACSRVDAKPSGCVAYLKQVIGAQPSVETGS